MFLACISVFACANIVSSSEDVKKIQAMLLSTPLLRGQVLPQSSIKNASISMCPNGGYSVHIQYADGTFSSAYRFSENDVMDFGRFISGPDGSYISSLVGGVEKKFNRTSSR